MLQALFKKGKIICDKTPAPVVSEGQILIRVVNSCISSGTEISGVQSSGTPLYKRAIKQPENVKKVFGMLKANGISKTISNVKNKLDVSHPTGYSLSGIVIVIGIGIGKNVANILFTGFNRRFSPYAK